MHVYFYTKYCVTGKNLHANRLIFQPYFKYKKLTK